MNSMICAKTSSGPDIALEVQRATNSTNIPADSFFAVCARAALSDRQRPVSLVVRIVETEEIRELNLRFRGQDKPTNVLSFPFEPLPGIEEEYLGDIVICAPVVEREAQEQGKSADSHWAHMTVHGILHLVGYDHMSETDAQAMESLEKCILERLNYADPYD